MLIPHHSREPGRGGLRRGAVALGAAVCLLGLLGGCTWFGTGSRPSTVLPADRLYAEGEQLLIQERYEAARESFQRLVERHPESELAPVASFLVGETYYRAGEFEKAVPEFQTFVTVHPGHAIADLGQYRLARSYWDQAPGLERDQALTARALAEFQRLIRLYPESRYAPDAIVKIEACRLRLAQKELWVADFYVRQGNLPAALQRYEAVLRDYSRTQAVPQALYQKAQLLQRLGRTDEAAEAFRRLDRDFPQSDWSRRARERQAARTGS